MNAIRPRIVHKGFILLSVPFAFAVITATTLLFLQSSYTQAVKAEALRTEIVYRINQLWTWNLSMTTSSLGTTLMKRTQTAETNEEMFAEHYAVLTELLADEPTQQQQLQQIERCHENVRILCDELQNSLSSQYGQLQQVLALSKNLHTWEGVIAKDMEAGNLIRSLKDFELQQSARASEQVRFLAGLIQLVLVGVIIGSVLIAYLLFRFFMQGIHRGVQALLFNIHRFQSAESLAPALAGPDELSLLDRRFHEMVDEVGAAQRMKQAFINTVSTELSIPIRSTRDQLTQLVAGTFGAISEEAKDRAEKAKLSLDRLMALLSDLLALQDPGKHRMEISPRACSLNNVIQHSIDAVSALAEKNNIQLVALTTDLTVYADPDRIVQVLVNLLSNAIKFSPAGASVVISAMQVADQVEVRVKDSGRGVPPHLREAIFERFQQVESSDGTEKGGTGLGLPICKEIVQLHGGRIGVISEDTSGSTFWFRLPANRSVTGEAPSAAYAQSAEQLARKSRWFVAKTIYAKGLVLISVPLIIELAFGTSLFSLQHFYEDKLNKERIAVEILFRANEMWINSAEFLLLEGQYTLFGGSKAPIEEKIARFAKEYDVLQKLVADDPLQTRHLELIKRDVDKILKVCSRLQPVVLANLSPATMRILRWDLRLFSRARTLVGAIQTEQIGKSQYRDKEARVKDVDLVTEHVNALVFGSLIASALVVVFLFAYFIRSINDGIKILMENTERFKQGKELQPPSTGEDELAQVDAAFHEMASEIREAQSTKQTIVSMISHDLRSPLTSVSGFFYLLNLGALGEVAPEVTALAERCQRDVDQLIRLITNLLDLDKIEAGMLAIQPTMLHVKQVMERAISEVTPLAPENTVTLDGMDATAEMYADHDRIVQALSNLLLSAVKVSPAGSSVDASAIQRNGNVEIRVTSANSITSGDLLSSQFDRFQKREHGLSLELPISKEIVKLHGGTIGATSEQHGCTLWVCLPARAPASKAA